MLSTVAGNHEFFLSPLKQMLRDTAAFQGSHTGARISIPQVGKELVSNNHKNTHNLPLLPLSSSSSSLSSRNPSSNSLLNRPSLHKLSTLPPRTSLSCLRKSNPTILSPSSSPKASKSPSPSPQPPPPPSATCPGGRARRVKKFENRSRRVVEVEEMVSSGRYWL